MQRLLLKSIDAQDLQNAVEALFRLELFFQNRHQDINTNGNPDLRFHRIFAGAIKVLDPQMLLNPLKEQLDLPTLLIEQSNRQGRKHKVIGEKDKALPRLGVHVMDEPQFGRVILEARLMAQPDGVITAHSGGGIHWARLQADELETGFGTGDKESSGQDKVMAL